MRINIIGRGEGWEEGYEAPGEHWAINYFHPLADILFEIHPPDHPYHEKLRRERENAEAAGIRLVTHRICKQLIKKDWGLRTSAAVDYYGSSTDYAISYALRFVCKPRYEQDGCEIHLYGVTMDDKGDHYEKRCATDFWCGVAMGRGIKVVVHGNSTVMTTADGLTYGTFTPMKRKYLTAS